jgi:glucokinase
VVSSATRAAADHEVVLGIDVGGTSVKTALIDRAGHLRGPRKLPNHPERGPDLVVEGILRIAVAAVNKAGSARETWTVRAIGLVVPGLVDEVKGIAVRSVNLGWTDIPLLRLLGERVGLPAALGHDVRSAALAERLLGAATGAGDFLFIALGAGVGAAIMIGEETYRGANGRAGEFGHTTVVRNGPRCTCGKSGCIEAFASGSAIERRYWRLTGAGQRVPTAEVSRRALAGDRNATRVWGEAVQALGMGIANYITLLDPDRVVMGGGVSAAGARLFSPLREAVAGYLPPFQLSPPILPAALQSYAGCVGAGIMAWSKIGEAVPAKQSEHAQAPKGK